MLTTRLPPPCWRCHEVRKSGSSDPIKRSLATTLTRVEQDASVEGHSFGGREMLHLILRHYSMRQALGH
eukprot:3444500-Prorocentrum_lima.AAC.1